VRAVRHVVVFWVTCLFAVSATSQAPAEDQQTSQAAPATPAAATAVRAVNVVIEGVEGELRANVFAFLSIAELSGRSVVARFDPRAAAETTVTIADLQRRHRDAPEQIRQALRPFGYYLPQISAELSEARNGYEARYRITPGTPTLVRNVEIRATGAGADHPSVRQALTGARADLVAGQRLIHSRHDAAREVIYDAAYNAGFLDARWVNRDIRVQPDRESADIRLVLETGPRFYFGEFDVQAERLAPEFIARFTDIEAGDPYDVRRLLRLQLELNEADYFSRVEVRADRRDADGNNHIPVQVVTEPARPQQYNVGAGYATDTGPRFNFGVVLRRLNPYGHRLRSDLQLSGIEQAIAGRYTIPVRNVATDRVDFSLTARRLDVGDADSTQYSAGVGQYVTWFGFRRRAYAQLQYEGFQIGEHDSQSAKLFMPGVTLTRERSDDMIFPRQGYSVQMDLRGASESALSDVSFLRLRTDMRWVRAVGERGRLLVRGEVGALDTVRFDDLPPTQRFYTGGDRTVRGYAYQMIGDRNETGDVIGGRYLVTGSVEYERLILGDFGAAVFIDSGDAFSDRFRASTGAGIGMRWRSPVGMVRIDVAHPFQHDDSIRLHLSIGADL
jgi:translocation and assembly module TamA